MSDADVSSAFTGSEIVASQRMLDAGDSVLRRAYPWPVRVVLEVAMVDFTVRSLMELHKGMVLETGAPYNEDLLLQVNGQVIGRAKFDVTGQMLAVRVTGVA